MCPMTSLSIVMASRDVGAASHLVVLYKALRSNGVSVKYYAQEPAYTFLKHMKIDVLAFQTSVLAADKVDSDEFAKAVLEAKAIIRSTLPDKIIVGGAHSGEVGIDELMIAYSGEAKTYLYQDYWGDFNDVLGVIPECYLVLDELAATTTKALCESEVFICGPLKYTDYQGINFYSLRARVREKYGISSKSKLIGYYGQSLSSLQGYLRTVDRFAAAIRDIVDSNTIELAYKPHPRESGLDIYTTVSIFREHGIDPVVIDEPDIINSLVATDLAVSCFSSCAYDHIHLNYYSNENLSFPLYLLYDQEVLDFYKESSKLESLPLCEMGLVDLVDDSASVKGDVLRNLDESYITKKLGLLETVLVDPQRNLTKLINYIESDR